MYTPEKSPTPNAWAEREFAKIAAALNTGHQLTVLYKAPEKPRDGLLVFADGTSWNPGNGAGSYVYVSGAWVSTSFGYPVAGVGGAVTQTTSKATGVTLSKLCGQITTHNASLGSGDSVAFRVTNSTVAATDVILLSLASGGTAAAYDYGIDKVGSGYFDVYLFNYNGGGALSEALVLNFAVIKAVAS